MSSLVPAILDAIVTAINAKQTSDVALPADPPQDGGPYKTFCLSFTAVRSYQPSTKLETLSSLQVYVMPTERTLASRDRTSLAHTIEAAVVVTQRLTTESDGSIANATIDPFIRVCEQVAEFLRFTTLGVGDARWTAGKIDPVIDPTELNQRGVFVGVVHATFEVTGARHV